MQLLDRKASASARPVDERDGPSPAPDARHDRRRAPGASLSLLGVAVTMIGMVGDLLVSTLDATPDTQGGLLALGRGGSPWQFVLFAGVLLTAVGGIRWAAHLGTDWGALASSATILLMVMTVAAVGWTVWNTSSAPPQRVVIAAVPNAPAGETAAAVHDHPAGGTGAVVADAGAEGQSAFGGHSHGQPGPITQQEARRTAWMLDQARRATAPYRSVAAAKADGYIQVTQFVPGLGLHLARVASALTGAFDFAHPNVLLYQPTRSGGLELVGVAYSVPHTGAWATDPPDGFPGGQDVWHYHTNLCFLSDGSVTITPDRPSCTGRGGYFQAQTPWLLHAWIWKANPTGVFTEYNPDVF